MKLEIKTSDSKQKILIVAKEKNSLVNQLKLSLEKLGGDIYYSSTLPKSFTVFDISFFINEKNIRLFEKKIVNQSVFIFIDQNKLAQKFAQADFKKSKIISIDGDFINENDIDKCLWFSFSKTKERFLKFTAKKTLRPKEINFFNPVNNLKKFLQFRSLLIVFFITFFVAQTLFIIPLVGSTYFNYLSYVSLKKENYNQLTDRLKWQKMFLFLTNKSYSFARPTLLFLSLAGTPDDLVEINSRVSTIFEKILIDQKGAKEIFSLILNKNKTATEKKLLVLRLNRLMTDLDEIGDSLTTVSNKLPSNLPKVNSFKKTILDGLDFLSQLKKIVPFFDELLAKDSEKKYLLLFANNMELRPGGGFIGSFGILTLKDYTLEEIKVYDVYDADGQLKAHIEPPAAIRDYLGQPHWFLRDSAFSPDFLDNYDQAKFFLEKELSLTGFSGGILTTTSAIENILDSFDSLYLPDFKEIVNKRNFYLKAQYYAEKDFFPGSIQKKSFLSSLTQQILLNLDSVSSTRFISAIKKSLDEKQLVIYIENPSLQETFQSLFWSGRLIEPKCINNEKNCIVDFLMPVDANLGINKANLFISRLITLKTNFDSDGKINHLLSVVFKNESQSDVFPGGSYKNYFQAYLPQTAIIKTITKNGVLVDENLISDEIKNVSFKTIGLFFEVKPKTTLEIKINYQLADNFKKGNGAYQLVVQKQIGSSNNDFISEVNLTNNYHLLNQNFIPLVKNNQILYNTYLSTDKIFFIELIRE